MLTLATHDTKRSPDVRARINILSEIPAEWETAATEWMSMTDVHSTSDWPDYNTRYLLFQTLVGVWPPDPARVVAYMDKVAKEAKTYTAWADPSADYDYALRRFVEGCLGDDRFRERVEAFLTSQRVVEHGRVASLAQTALLLTCPGVPDIYQGTEVWDDSLVDPDNRRPVDFERLRRQLGQLDSGGPVGATDDVAKMWLVSRLLRHRRSDPGPYSSQIYQPLEVYGPAQDHVIAFARDGLVTVVPRLARRLDGDWADTAVVLPIGTWRSVLGPGPDVSGGQDVARLTGDFPVAVLARIGS
jgi:(1->4)-alpha-D-glucan 1-alpha-D-glucosylmutase